MSIDLQNNQRAEALNTLARIAKALDRIELLLQQLVKQQSPTEPQ